MNVMYFGTTTGGHGTVLFFVPMISSFNITSEDVRETSIPSKVRKLVERSSGLPRRDALRPYLAACGSGHSRKDDEMRVHSKRKWPRDGRELLPFEVHVASPPPTYLGEFMLDPRTHNGDLLEHNEKAYIVKRTRLHYFYRNGEFQVCRKSVDVNTVARSHVNSFLERVYRKSREPLRPPREP